MLLTFKSKGAADVLMYEAHAKPLLDLLNKELKRGVITAAEAGPAVVRLEQEIAQNKARETPPDMDEDDEDKAREVRTFVSFGTRAYPLLEMLRAAQRGSHDVMWGV